ncbi:MAG TPA: zinc ribbon domain-containing protein [Polyangiaceae bacterium]
MTYEYVCTACGSEWEAEQSISEPPLKECPKCHASSAKRQVSGGAGFILKGGGWYADGYGSSSKKAESAKTTESTSSSVGSSTSEASSSSKSDTTSDTSSPKKTDTTSGPKGSSTAAA